MISRILLKSALLTALISSVAFCDTWTQSEIKSIRLVSEKLLQFEAVTWQCSGAPCTTTMYYVVEASPMNWPSHSSTELRAFHSMLLAAMTTGRQVTLNFGWNGYVVPGASGGNYFLNWVEMAN